MNDIKQSVNAQFSQVAANYKTSQVHATGHELQTMAKLIAGSAKVLDLGCGAGHASMAVAPVCGTVTAYDLSADMLAQVDSLAAERGVSNIQTQQGDVEALPFDDAQFDAIVTRYSAHHWPNPLTALAEARRVLKPSGTLLVCDIVAPEQPAADSFLQTFEILRDMSHVRDFRVSEWQRMLTTVGFAPELVDQWRMQISFTKWTTRMATPAPKVAMIEALFDEAQSEIRATFDIAPNRDYKLFCALLQARPRVIAF